MSVTVKPTSTAGVAQQTWTQKMGVIQTISGAFTGHEDLEASPTTGRARRRSPEP